MKIFLLGLLICFNSWAKVELFMNLDHEQVQQGEILEGRLTVKQTEGQAALGGLKGKNFAKTLYLLNVSPFIFKQGQLESEAKIIFLAVPQANYISETINGEEVTISWSNVVVTPTEDSKSFLLGDFSIPNRKQILNWIIILLVISSLAGTIVWLRKIIIQRNDTKNRTKQLKHELVKCESYEEIVGLWRQKRRYLEAFPQISDLFKNLEAVLFKSQFKPTQTKTEIEEVISAYKTFKNEVSLVIHEK